MRSTREGRLRMCSECRLRRLSTGEHFVLSVRTRFDVSWWVWSCAFWMRCPLHLPSIPRRESDCSEVAPCLTRRVSPRRRADDRIFFQEELCDTSFMLAWERLIASRFCLNFISSPRSCFVCLSYCQILRVSCFRLKPCHDQPSNMVWRL